MPTNAKMQLSFITSIIVYATNEQKDTDGAAVVSLGGGVEGVSLAACHHCVRDEVLGDGRL